jgi:hypothetical protein
MDTTMTIRIDHDLVARTALPILRITTMTHHVPRALSVLLLAMMSACASGGPSTSTAARPATQTVGRGDIGTLVMSTTASADVAELPHSADAVWGILPSVFDSLGVPITNMDPARKAIGNPGFRIRSRLGKVSLSRYLDCGSTQIGPNADNYDVVLTVMTVVAAKGATASTLTTSVEAQARPATYTQQYSRCSSKGGIETRLTDLVKARLTK